MKFSDIILAHGLRIYAQLTGPKFIRYARTPVLLLLAYLAYWMIKNSVKSGGEIKPKKPSIGECKRRPDEAGDGKYDSIGENQRHIYYLGSVKYQYSSDDDDESDDVFPNSTHF